MTLANATQSGLVDDFRERRLRLAMNQDEVGVEAEMHRDTVSAIEGGGGSPVKRRKLDQALTRLEADAGLPALHEVASSAPAAEVPPAVIRLTVEGVYGAKALIVEGPVESLPELEAMVDRIMRRIQQPQPEE